VVHRPTILQIIPRLDTGGAELSAIEITDAIVRGGGRAIVATEGGRMADRVTAAGGELLIMAAGTKNPFRMLANVRALCAVIGSQSVDLIHARSRAPAWSALAAARRTRIPFVTTYHGAYGENGSLKRLYNSVMARADVIIANSNYTSRLIQSRYGTVPTRIRVIHRGVDEAAFDPAQVSPARLDALRQRFGVGAGQRIILQAARLTSWKGQGVLIDAAARLRETGRLGDAVVILAGDAQGREAYATELAAQIKARGLEGAVRLVGHVDDIPAALCLAHVAVIASTEPEAFGRSVTEAGAMGCPAIATDLGAPPETLLAPPLTPAERATGWLVAPGDAAALAEAVAQALAMAPADRLAMGRRARDHVLRHFSLTAMKAATLATYDEILGTAMAAAAAGNGINTPQSKTSTDA
jgi:glycosyltransferase involved in cell wall biosynthesis